MPGMGRRLRLAVSNPQPPPGPVSIRSIDQPRGCWAITDAVRMVRVGYDLDHAAARTGYAPAHVAALVELGPPRCHVEHITDGGGRRWGRKSYAVGADWTVCPAR
jgi:hypothetical protein